MELRPRAVLKEKVTRSDSSAEPALFLADAADDDAGLLDEALCGLPVGQCARGDASGMP